MNPMCNCALPAITGSFDCCKGCNPQLTGKAPVESQYISNYWIVTDKQLTEMIDKRIEQALKEHDKE